MSAKHRFRIYLALEGVKKPLLGPQLSELFDHFDLIPAETRYLKRLRLFLQSPYFVEDEQILPFFEHMYKTYRSSADHIKGRVFLKKFFKRVDYKMDRKVILRLTKELRQLILKFCRDLYLQEHALEDAQLNVELARNRASKPLFAALLKEWQQVIDQQAGGTKKVYHQWRKYHQALISTQSSKHRAQRAQELSDARSSLNKLGKLGGLIYQHDALSYEHQYQHTSTLRETSAVDYLIYTYQQLLTLRQHKTFSLAMYRSAQELVMQHGPNFTKEHHFICAQLMLNYVSTHYGTGKTFLRKELLFWLHYQIHYQLFSTFEHISRSTLLNNLIMLFINNEVKLAEELLHQLSSLIASSEQELTLGHAEVALAFYQHKHEKVLGLLGLHFPKSTMAKYVDALRLKSYQLRSLLCLLTADFGKYAPLYSKASHDFDIYLQRQSGDMSEQKITFFRNFLKACDRIFRAMENHKYAQKQSLLQQQLTEQKSMHSKHWLIAFVESSKINRYGQLQANMTISPQLKACAAIRG